MDPLQQHLEQGRGEGDLVERGGVFTLNTEKAHHRRARFALGEPGLWLVKLVQAAVAAEAPEVRVTFGRRRVMIRYQAPSGWDAASFLEQFSAVEDPPERSLYHLRTGLTAAIGLPEAVVVWSVGKSRVTVAGGSVDTEQLESPLEELRVEVQRARSGAREVDSTRFPIMHLVKDTAAEFLALVERCRVCPVPVWVDGFSVRRSYCRDPATLPLRPGWVGTGQALVLNLLSVRSARLPGRTTCLPYPVEEIVWDERPYTDDGKTFATQIWKPEGEAYQAVVCLLSAGGRDSELIFTMDGVELVREVLPRQGVLKLLEGGRDEDFHLRVFLEVSLQEVDLSEFQVREFDREAVLEALVPDLITMMDELRKTCHRPWKFRSFRRQAHPYVLNLAQAGETAGIALAMPFILCLGLVLAPLGLLVDSVRGSSGPQVEMAHRLARTMERLERHLKVRTNRV